MTKIKFAIGSVIFRNQNREQKSSYGHIIEIGARADFKGIELDTIFLDGTDPASLKAQLQKFEMDLAVLRFSYSWPEEEQAAEEQIWLSFMEHFANTLLVLDTHKQPHKDAGIPAGVQNFASRAAARKIKCSYLPGVLATEQDYDRLINTTHSSMGLSLDIADIAGAGLDPAYIIRKYADRTDCIYYTHAYAQKNPAREGKQARDLVTITNFLKTTGYEGWIVLQDQSELSQTDADSAAMATGLYKRKVLDPLIDHTSLTQFNNEL